MNFSGPGWVVRQGQVVWKPDAESAGVAGDLLLAMHPDGRQVVQFTKTPLPFLVAQRTTDGWQVQVIPRHKTYSGRGEPPARLLWLHLPDARYGSPAGTNGFLTSKPDGSFHFENRASGESIEGFLDVTSRPRTHALRQGDSLSVVGRFYGVGIQALRDANLDVNPTRLRISQVINIPPLLTPP